MRRKISSLLVVALLASLCTLFLGVAPASATATGFYPVDDTYVDKGNATTNFSTTNPLFIRGADSSEKWAYLSFDVDYPATEIFLSSATLRVRVSQTVVGQSLKLYSASSGHDASDRTWNNKSQLGVLLDTQALPATSDVDVTFNVPNVAEAKQGFYIQVTGTGSVAKINSVEATTVAKRPLLTTNTATSCSGTNLTTSNNLQTELTNGTTNQVFCLAGGTYRIATPLTFKDGQRFFGASGGAGAILSGSAIISSWTAESALWYGTRVVNTALNTHGECAAGNTTCTYTNDVFYGTTALVRVANKGDLSAGEFWEDIPNNRVYIADNPSGVNIEQAKATSVINTSANNIRVENLTVQRAANEAQTAAIHITGNGAVVDHNVVKYNHGAATFVISGTTTHNDVHHQGQIGVGGHGDAGLWQENEVHHNNTAGYSVGWEAGGGKIAFHDGAVVRGNYYHHDTGKGIWFDIDNRDTVIVDNDVRNESDGGILYEISFNAKIHGNKAINNNAGADTGLWTGAQIMAQNSQDVEMYDNWVYGLDGIGAINQDRGVSDLGYGTYEVRNLNVHDNEVSGTCNPGTCWGQMAGINVDDGSPVYTTMNNHFEDNNYHVPTTQQDAFGWDDNFENWTEWNADGNDDTGTASKDNTIPSIPSAPTLSVGIR